MYDSLEIKNRVSKKRRLIIIEFSIVFSVMAVLLVLIIANLNAVLSFISIIVELVLLFVIYKIFDVQSPGIYFSREVKGVNIKEDEYISRKTPGTGLGWRQIGAHAPPQPFAPNTGANKKRSAPSIKGRVYVRLENGDVKEISFLHKAHTDLYTEGDTLLKYAGTCYPVIINRNVREQPCPLCGEVNDMSESCCRSCGLAILNQEKEP